MRPCRRASWSGAASRAASHGAKVSAAARPFSSPAAIAGQTTKARLEAFAATDDGFRLAEMDLEQRGPGELLGTLQHGLTAGLYPEALTDASLIAAARDWAVQAAAHGGDRCKSSLSKPFRGRAVATSDWIW